MLVLGVLGSPCPLASSLSWLWGIGQISAGTRTAWNRPRPRPRAASSLNHRCARATTQRAKHKQPRSASHLPRHPLHRKLHSVLHPGGHGVCVCERERRNKAERMGVRQNDSEWGRRKLCERMKALSGQQIKRYVAFAIVESAAFGSPSLSLPLLFASHSGTCQPICSCLESSGLSGKAKLALSHSLRRTVGIHSAVIQLHLSVLKSPRSVSCCFTSVPYSSLQ